MSIISIVPRLPPTIDGVGDYAYCLAQQMRQDFGIQTHFIVGEPSWRGAPDLDDFPVSLLERRSAIDLSSLLKQLSASTILLHYVGYGYSKRGCPTWLTNGLQKWQLSAQDSSLVTMFHEVYAAGRPPWTSAFWLFPLQKYLAIRLANLSESLVTSKQLYANILNSFVPQHGSIPVLPVFSNVGEPNEPPPLAERRKKLIIFGGAANRTQIYQSTNHILSQVCQLFKIEIIVDIGPEIVAISEAFGNVPIITMGQLAASEISQHLMQSTVGFLNYNPDYLGKSGIFAAYCAHGVLPINVSGSIEEIDGLLPGTHYLVADKLSKQKLDVAQIQAIADSAHAWYQAHNLKCHATIFHTKLTEKLI